MNDLTFAENLQLVPLVSPVDAAATAQTTVFIPAKLAAGNVTFIIPFGTITGSDTNQVTLEASTAADTTGGNTEIAVPFYYRLSTAVGSDSWGAVTSADSGGVAITSSDDDKILLVEYDPRVEPGYPFVRCVVTPGSASSACEVAVLAAWKPRYAQNVHISST